MVLASERTALSPEAVSQLSPGAVLGVLSPASDAAVTLPDAARGVAREKRVRILPIPTGSAGLDAGVALAAACAGASLAAAQRAQKTTVDPVHVARAVSAYFHARNVEGADHAGERARRAFEAALEAAHAAETAAQNGDASHALVHRS
jgi:hypothetical protein